MILALLLACPKVEEGVEAAPGPVIPVGTWTSPSCGERTYARELTVAQDASFTLKDLVSPCPEGVTCIWSGVVEYHGSMDASGNLKYAEEADPRGMARPSAVRIDAGGAALDDLGCRYAL